ncbi:MAG: hypothetical protein ABW223_08290 [Rariglobus sp.]
MENSRVDASLENHVPGTWKRLGPHGEVMLGASHRSLKTAAGTLAVSLFWNGIVSVFVMIALGSTLTLLGVTLPDSFPKFKNESGSEMSWGFTIFLWCFLTPFIAIGSCMIVAFLMSVGGKTVITLHRGSGKLFTGIGPVGWTRRFVQADVTRVSLRTKFVADNDGGGHQDEKIYIERRAGNDLTCGGSLPKRRKYQLAALLRQALRPARRT